MFLLGAACLACGCGDATSSRLETVDAPPCAEAGCVAEPNAASARAATKTWTVRPGDSLAKIARQCYGDERLWKAIRDANPGKVAADGGVVVGAVLVVPFDGM